MTEEVVKFLHNTIFKPTPSTPINTIDNDNLEMWPMITEENVKKHLPKS